MAHPDMNALLDESIRLAVLFLEKNGEFFPFGVTMAPDGTVSHMQGYAGDDQPPSQELIDLLLYGLQTGASSGDYKSTSLIYDVRVSLDGETKTDAISVTLEHRDEHPVTCLVPYTKTTSDIELGEIIAQRADRNVFTQ